MTDISPEALRALADRLARKTIRVHDLSGVGYVDDPDCLDAATALYAIADRDEAVGWVRHKTRGSIYAVVGTASLQTVGSIDEGASLVIYRGANGELWARPKEEFHDGRFEALPAAPKGGEG
jgi:hypothetical protein